MSEKMKPSEIANIQSMIGVGQWLRHDCIVKILGSWETDDAIYMVEEYAVHGDIMQVGGWVCQSAGAYV